MSIYTLGVADMHAGSNFGLIPPHLRKTKMRKKDIPKHWLAQDEKTHGYSQLMFDRTNSAIETSALFWDEFQRKIKQLPKIDYAFFLSDNVEGKAKRSGTPELIASSDYTQLDIAQSIAGDILEAAGNPKVWGCHGTEYHVGDVDDMFYQSLPNMQGWEGVMYVEPKKTGLIWRLQHHISRSGTPYGKQTPLSKGMVFNSLKAAQETEHEADVSLYGHVHYCVGSTFPFQGKRGKSAYTLPALKLTGERYGWRFNDYYHVGLTLFAQEKAGDQPRVIPIKFDVGSKLPKLYTA